MMQLATEKLELKKRATRIPMAMDRERATTNAINAAYPNANLDYCQNHIVQDVEHWIRQQKDYTEEDIKGLLA